MSNSDKTILVVDDEPRIADTLALILQHAGYVATAVYNAKDAMARVATRQPSLIITDVIMPGLDGIELAKMIRASCPDCKILLFSGNADTQQLLEKAEQQGHTFQIIAKPVPPPQILATVASLLDQNPAK